MVGVRPYVSRGLLTAALLLVAFGQPGQAPAQQDARDLYRNGVRAVEAQDWPTAIKLIRQAIEVDPTARAGTFRKYIPHFYLGYSLYQLGNCKAALTVWEESHKQGVIKKLKEYQDLQQGVTVCRRRIKRADLEVALTDLRGFASALGDLRDQPELAEAWRVGDPSWDDRFAVAEQLMDDAQSVLQNSESQVQISELEEANAQVTAAAKELQVIQSEARSKYSELQARVDVQSRMVGELQTNALQVLDSTLYLEPYPPQLAERRLKVQRLVVELETAGSSMNPDRLEDLRLELSRSVENLRQASAPPSESLLEVAAAYLSADYPRVLTLMDGSQFPSGRELAHARLFEAASLFHLWVEGGEADDTLRSDASRAVQSCREENIALVPLDRAFSPRFIEFFFAEGRVRAPLPLDE